MERDGESRPVTVTGWFEDFREVRGMLHPFRTVMSMEGMAPAITAYEMAEARRSLAELRSQMESMPAAQREMMERVVRPQIEQIERVVGGEGMAMTIEVTELRVNTGPPPGR
jgi:hypothetical protein